MLKKSSIRDFWEKIKISDLAEGQVSELLKNRSVLATVRGYRYRISIPDKPLNELEDSDLIIERDPRQK